MPAFWIIALSNMLERIVLDETGLKGRYDFQVEWMPDQNDGYRRRSVASGVDLHGDTGEAWREATVQKRTGACNCRRRAEGAGVGELSSGQFRRQHPLQNALWVGAETVDVDADQGGFAEVDHGVGRAQEESDGGGEEGLVAG